MKRLTFILAASAMAFCGTSVAAVSADEAARLGKDLTPWGADRLSGIIVNSATNRKLPSLGMTGVLIFSVCTNQTTTKEYL